MHQFYKALFLIIGINFTSLPAMTNTVEDYLTIDSSATQEIVEPPSAKGLTKMSFKYAFKSQLSEADLQCRKSELSGHKADFLKLSLSDLGNLVKIGKKVWAIIENNRPVVNLQTDSVAVMPLAVECWRWLEGWQNPVSKSYRTTFNNKLGSTVVDFTYKVIYLPGGRFKGKGQYLARVALVPENLDVTLGYKFNAQVTVPTILNYGTVVDPIAAVELQLQYTVETFFQYHTSTANFLVKGNGEGLEL